MNPSAVLVEGPGYIGGDGRSVMPPYPDMTLGQLVSLVAYLKTLTAAAYCSTTNLRAMLLPPSENRAK